MPLSWARLGGAAVQGKGAAACAPSLFCGGGLETNLTQLLTDLQLAKHAVRLPSCVTHPSAGAIHITAHGSIISHTGCSAGVWSAVVGCWEEAGGERLCLWSTMENGLQWHHGTVRLEKERVQKMQQAGKGRHNTC